MTSKLMAAADQAAAHVRHLTERLAAEIGVANELCALHPEKSPAWQPLIAKAEGQASEALASGDLTALRRAVETVETTLAPLGPVAKTYTIHGVGHAHIDMNWMWSWPETVAVTVDTFTTVLRLMELYPDFCFSQSQASVYALVEEHRPDLLKTIARRVKEGRWEVTASHWVEGDKNLASAESLCRHILYTRRYLQKLFKLAPEDVTIDWSPDTFGHPATVPTYLVRGGVKYLYMHRPGTWTPERPWLFWWEGPDGTRVLVRNDSNTRSGYNGAISADLYRETFTTFKATGLQDTMYVYGVGDHGGGPTRRDLEMGMELSQWPIYPRFQFSTTRRFFDTVAPQGGRLPVHRGELNVEFTGCYTTQTLIKKANRFGENRLVDAEIAAALTHAAVGAPYPGKAFETGWRNVLFNHFHDILPGSGVMDTRTYSHGLFQQTMAATAQAETQSLRLLATAVDTSAGTPPATRAAVPPSRLRSGLGAGVGHGTQDGGLSRADVSTGQDQRPFVLFNPTAFDRDEVVEVAVWDNGPAGTQPMRDRSYDVRTPDGALIPAQVLGGGGYWGHDHATLAFPARVPGLGHAVYTVIETAAGAAGAPAAGPAAVQSGAVHHCGYAFVERSVEGLENEFVRVELDPVTGGIRRLLDRRTGVELVTPDRPAPILEYETERPHGMTAWLIDHAGAVPEPMKTTALRRTLKGPHKVAIEVDQVVHESTFTLTYELRAGDPRLHVHLRGTWFQRGTKETGVPALAFVLPLALREARARYEIPFGAIERALNGREEVPARQWAQVTGIAANGASAGCLLVNDSKYGHSLDGSTLRLTLIRSSYEPDILPEIGQHEVHLALLPFAGDLDVAAATRAGDALNHALRAVGTDVHVGALPATARYLTVTPAAIGLCGLKKAEDGERLVVRLVNPNGTDVKAEVIFDKAAPFAPVGAEALDLMERPVKGQAVTRKGRTIATTIPAFGFVTLGIELKKEH